MELASEVPTRRKRLNRKAADSLEEIGRLIFWLPTLDVIRTFLSLPTPKASHDVFRATGRGKKTPSSDYPKGKRGI